MFSRSRLVLFYFILFTKAEICTEASKGFTLVSTSERPTYTSQDISNQFANLEDKLELKTTLIRKETALKFEETLSILKKFTHVQYKDDIPQNCKEVQDKVGNISDVYLVKPELATEPFLVFCDMKTNGGGWTYVLNRFDGSQDFYLKWNDYKLGFGNLMREFWIGLEHLHQLTGSQVNELLVELVDWDMKKVYARYDDFGIGDESEAYNLKILGRFSGDAGDSLADHSGHKFSTRDRDHDINDGSCAELYRGAWWYKTCFSSHLTGPYERNGVLDDYHKGIQWPSSRGILYSFKQARMMVRPRINNSPEKLPHEN